MSGVSARRFLKAVPEVKAVEGGAGEGAFVFVFGEFDDFVVDVIIEPGGDLNELVLGEGGEGGVGVRRVKSGEW